LRDLISPHSKAGSLEEQLGIKKIKKNLKFQSLLNNKASSKLTKLFLESVGSGTIDFILSVSAN